jgi:hypothetical protein
MRCVKYEKSHSADIIPAFDRASFLRAFGVTRENSFAFPRARVALPRARAITDATVRVRLPFRCWRRRSEENNKHLRRPPRR